jgi:gas vesicle protein GvpL/GvpF
VVAAGSDVAGLRGLDHVEVEVVEHAGLGAVVSPMALERPAGRSAELVAHARVVDGLAAATEVVPAQFGWVLDHDLGEVTRVLGDGAERFHALLERLAGHVQLNLRASYESQQVLAELVRQDPRVAELRARAADLPPVRAHPHLVQLGEAVARGLTRKRVEDADALLDVVLPKVATHVVRQEGEYDVLDVALLAERARVPALEADLEALAEAVHERMRLRLVGPVAPYDFVGDATWG